MKYSENLYGQMQYGDTDADIIKPEVLLKIMEHIPTYYRTSGVMNSLQHAIEEELKLLYEYMYHVFNQLYVDTATWGLDLWESLLGLPNGFGKPQNYRRSNILSRLMGWDITTKDMLRMIGAVTCNARTEIFEFPQDNMFVIKFIEPRGLPKNMLNLQKNIDEIKPAHLVYQHEYAFCRWYEAAFFNWNFGGTMIWNNFYLLSPEENRTKQTRLRSYEAKFYSWEKVISMLWENFHNATLEKDCDEYIDFYLKGEDVEPGDVVFKNPNGMGYIRTVEEYCPSFVGVVMDENSPEILISPGDKKLFPVKMSGHVTVKVTGAVKPGDPLVTSNIKGVAKVSKKYEPDAFIGKALEGFRGEGTGKIQILMF